jgi:transcriptional regulator with XRE-family HTH domain
MLRKQIEFLRRKKGWSQAELANRLHISPSTIGMYEQGRREPPIDILVAMSNEFDVSIDYLITGTYRISAGTETNLVKDRNVEAFSTLKNLSREELIVLLAAQMIGQ